MANLVKITEVQLYTGLTEDAAECFACKKILDSNNIKYNTYHYGDDSQHQTNFDALSTWTFGPDYKQYKFTKFPIVMWKEYFDDYERWMEVVTTAADLSTSTLVKNAALVK